MFWGLWVTCLNPLSIVFLVDKRRGGELTWEVWPCERTNTKREIRLVNKKIEIIDNMNYSSQ